MSRRMALLEFPDTQSEDDLHLAVALWNADEANRKIEVTYHATVVI